jgi:hypothetical protein
MALLLPWSVDADRRPVPVLVFCGEPALIDAFIVRVFSKRPVPGDVHVE